MIGNPSDALAPGGPACGEFPAELEAPRGWAPAGGGRCWAGPGGSPRRRRPGWAGWGAPAGRLETPTVTTPGKSRATGPGSCCLYSWVVCACLGVCGAEDVRDFFFFSKILVAGMEAASLLSSVSGFASNLLYCVLRVSRWLYFKTALFSLFSFVPK